MKRFSAPAVRILIALVFIVSGYSKLLEPYDRVLDAVLGYQILQGGSARAMAFVLPWTELILGVFLLCGVWLEASMLLLWGMNFVFLMALESALLRGISLESCGCFGEGLIKLKPNQVIGLDLALFAGFFFMACRHANNLRYSLDGYLEARAPRVSRTRNPKI
ncbi:MAG: MauE/DoxX family redox-associated membrane protein [Candidatus Omnitrophota bacterium]